MILKMNLKNRGYIWVDEILWPPCLWEELKANGQGFSGKINLERFWVIVKQTLVDGSILDRSGASLQHKQFY